jgi:hypothetical protein
MEWRRYLSGVWGALRGYPAGEPDVPEATPRWNTEAERYAHLRAYRASGDLYGRLRNELKARGYEGYKNVRNPVHALTELYAFKLPEGALEALEAPEELVALVESVWESSNWEDRSEVAARDYSVTGDLFLKAANDERDAFVQWLDPAHVTELDADRKGHLTFCRLDVPQGRRTDEGEEEHYTETEVWDKERGYHAVFEHDGDASTPLGDLLSSFEGRGSKIRLTVYELLQEPEPEDGAEWTGFDFVPVVHRKLRDTGAERGEGAYQHALDAVDEANQMATRLHNMLFPEMALAFTRGDGPDGDSLPPMRLEDEEAETYGARLHSVDAEQQKVVRVAGMKVYRLPSGADVKTLIPQVQIEAHAGVLAAQVKYIVDELLPELQYRALKDMGQLSGRAARLYLSDAVDRLGRARAKYDDGVARALQMCLTIGKVAGLEGYEDVPDYDERRTEIRFAKRDVLALSELDEAEEEKRRAEIRQTYHEMGLLRLRLEEEGLEEEAVERILSEASQSAGRSAIADILGG